MNDPTPPAAQAPATPGFRRVLTFWDLVLYGIVLIMPIAPVPLFGVVQKLSIGHAVTTILLAMVAMMLTALSYGRMAAVYPSAGSAYTYVGRALHPHLGFLAGWAMLLDYVLVPLICTIYGALTVQRLVPWIPYPVLCAVFAGAMTLINVKGIRATVNANLVLMVVMTTVILAFIALAVRLLFAREGWAGLLSTQPFYDTRTFQWKALGAGTAVAALTYGGFDGITTLSEDVKNPRRAIPVATVFVCLFTGIFGGLQIYLAQRVWPDFTTFANLETAFMDVSRVVGGSLLFGAMAAILIVANLGCGLSAQAGISRLLFGMGRDKMLPAGFFAHLDERRSTPLYNILLVGGIAMAGALILDYERAAELINFGAFLAFMGVNASVIRHFYFSAGRPGRRLLPDLVLPAAGLAFCFLIWLQLSVHAKIVGSIWFAAGLVWDAIQTRGFRTTPAAIDFSDV
ncbi:APC family permease [uncultured Paludibaculum sp.]|uniref:APC family permease n=1 Tax=uncultured Paludibaculum sp. TaxID=1765020 RepID=UPI002AAB9A60|nr:APC family permease [uncultured Paludibaculum sp.]